MTGPRKDTKGIVDASELLARVSFRRVEPAVALRDYVEHYWLIDWDLEYPHEQHVVPHPSVNIVFMQPGEPEVAGVGRALFSIKLEGIGRVSGVQFRPGGFHPFLRDSVSTLTDRRVPLAEVFPELGGVELGEDRAAALDGLLLQIDPQPDPLAAQAISLVDAIRKDRAILRVEDFARDAGMSVRSLQRLFAEYVGVSPKWVVLRNRIHEALELAAPGVDWARLAADLGYSDQAHLIRDFTATIGVSPSAYVRP